MYLKMPLFPLYIYCGVDFFTTKTSDLCALFHPFPFSVLDAFISLLSASLNIIFPFLRFISVGSMEVGKIANTSVLPAFLFSPFPQKLECVS